MKERGIAFLAGLWRFLAAIWTLVIVSALAGALGNIIYTFATTGTITFANLHNLTSWLFWRSPSAPTLPTVIRHESYTSNNSFKMSNLLMQSRN